MKLMDRRRPITTGFDLLLSMELSAGPFWDNFYREPREEWYFPMESMNSILIGLFRQLPFPIVLHGGCGNSLLGQHFLGLNLQLIEFDISPLALHQRHRGSGPHLYNLFLDNVLSLSLQSSSVDVVIEKGLFDSLTSITASAPSNSFRMLSQYDRVLRPQGFVIIFSIFGPDSAKDTLGLLGHPNFTVECKNIFTAPAEIPSQDFCYVYLLRKI
jgi:hypothetical protein